jgi:cytochrome c-type biogenesis protein CcmH/NrfG
MGEWYLRTRNFPAARKAFDAANAADPKFQPALLALAELDHQEKHLDAAHQRLLAMVNTDPENIAALLILGQVVQTLIERWRAAWLFGLPPRAARCRGRCR